ncbi:MAG: helix-turn-helix domain-containing protein, partial [Rickettsiales bacterium]|nr:helix-turn-helix domain-containing protein [Rickettsiales bacterium]
MSSKGVQSIRKRFVVNGFEATLHGQPKSGRPRALSEKDETTLVALVCEEAPDGHSRQTIRGLSAKFVTEDGSSVSHMTIARA